MFTGIVQTIGRISSIENTGEDMRIAIDLQGFDVSDVVMGDSVCINGVCVTVIEMSGQILSFDISKETLSCTTFTDLKINSGVNIELAMQVSDRLDGHIVSGHIDVVASLLSFKEEGRSVCYEFEMPESYSKFICPKGSVCIDGVSLTVNSVNDNIFSVNIIPHTLQNTIFSEYTAGRLVNIEVDIISRYLERLLQYRQ